ncbi:MAG: phosphatase PAP2 family protein [Methanobrevibacter sp.]|nr:phosphatase PAP2 family protein [Candidatus Methanovirga meridionalis]
MPLPFIWFFWLPLIIWFVCGKGKDGERAFWQYCSISLLMYVVSIIIYVIIPTVYFQEQFIDGTYSTLPNNAMFHDSIKSLATNSLNIFAAFPSYHNYWAGILVLFGIIGFKNKHHILGPILMVYGLTISISTLVLHQHALLDFILTYIMIGIFYFITIKLKIGKI